MFFQLLNEQTRSKITNQIFSSMKYGICDYYAINQTLRHVALKVTSINESAIISTLKRNIK